MCTAWMNFENFIRDMGPRPSMLHSIERKDNDGPYTPGNCIWGTRAEQAANKRKTVRVYNGGDTASLMSICRARNIRYSTVQMRISRGRWPIERAFNERIGNHNPIVIDMPNGDSVRLSEACRTLNLDYNTIRQRIRKLGWPISKALGFSSRTDTLSV